VTEYLLELYAARADAVDQDTARVRLAAEEHTRAGTPVRYLRSIFVPDDETCFHVIEAPSAEAVAEIARRAGLPVERVVEASSAV